MGGLQTKLEINLKGEIKDAEFAGIREAIENITKTWIWSNIKFNTEQFKGDK